MPAAPAAAAETIERASAKRGAIYRAVPCSNAIRRCQGILRVNHQLSTGGAPGCGSSSASPARAELKPGATTAPCGLAIVWLYWGMVSRLASLFTPPGHGDDPPSVRRLVLGLVLLATLAVYAATVDFGFVYDDRTQIILNPFLRSWRYFSRYFLRDVWSQAGRGQGSNYYRPIFMVWLRVNYALFHLKPAGWHLAVVFLHVGVTGLVYLLARKLMKDWRKAAFTAALFGLNPIHLEAVAWVSGVTEPLVAGFVLGSFLCYLEYRQFAPLEACSDRGVERPRTQVADLRSTRRGTRGRKWGWQAASWLLYFVATLAKETALVFPLLIAVYECFFASSGMRQGSPIAPTASLSTSPQEGKALANPRAPGQPTIFFFTRLKSALGAAVPFILLTLVYLELRLRALGAFVHPLAPMAWRYLAYTLPQVVCFYLKLLVWPAKLSIYYDLRWVRHPGFVNFWLPLGALAVIGAGLAGWSRGRPVIGIAAVWLFLFLVPVLDLQVFPAGNFIQDRYLYLPSIGFSILVVEFLAQWVRRRSSNSARLSVPAMSVALVVLLGYAVGTVTQSTYWASDTLLFYRALQLAPRSPYPKNDLGAALMEQKHWKRAMGLFRASIAADPRFGYPWGNLAYMYYATGEYQEAVECAEEFLRLYPDTPDGYYLLGVSEYELDHLRRAEEYLGYALGLKPYAYGFHYALGLTLLKEGKLHRALLEFEAEPRHSTKRADALKQIALIRNKLRARSTAPSARP